MKWAVLGVLGMMAATPSWALNDGLGGGAPAVAPKAAAPAAEAPAAVAPHENSGKVLSEKSGSGYTYVELENQGKKFWVAGPTTKVKKGDKVNISPNVVMEGFNSKFMNRTFERIIFASAITVVK
ncbi:MAG: NrfJ-related protein [Gammaproteobacteria bacterium]|nr:NrfJ-related protein [Gammaproteobacteria bacterium]